MQKPLLPFMLVMLCSSWAFAQTFIGPDEDIKAITANVERFSSYVVASDYEKIASSYAEEGKIMPGGKEIITGKEAIIKAWTLPEGWSITHHEILPEEIKILGDHAYDYGYYNGVTKKDDGTETSWKGKYVVVWKKTDGEWKMYLDIWNRVN